MLFGKYINRYYIKYLPLFILGIAALIVVDLVQLKIPEYLGQVVDILSNNGDTSLIGGLSLKVLIVAAIIFVGRFIWRVTLINAGFKIEADLRHDMFLKAEQLPREYYHDNKVGAIMSWFTNDLETISECMQWGTVMFVDSIFLSIITILQMFNLDVVMTLICFIPIALIIVWGAITEKFMAIKWDQRQKAYDTLYDFAQENFTGIRVIKAFVKESKEIHAFAKVAKKNADVNVSFARISVIFDVFIEVIIVLIFFIAMLFGGLLIYGFVHGEPFYFMGKAVELTPAKLITFIGYIDILIWPMIATGQIISMLSRGRASLKRVSAFLNTEVRVKSPYNAIKLENVKGDITYKNFNFTYPNYDAVNLKNINLEIKAGERIGIVGKIGGGKTTFVNVLLMLYNVEPNTLFIDGHDIMSLDIRSLREQIAYVPQDNFLFSDSIEHNINFGIENGSEETARLGAVFAGIDEDVKGFKTGYQTVSGERGVTLSGGQKQRISIARAYVKNAPILILDDSVSAVDTKTEETILHNISAERKGKTTLVVASRVSTVQHLDKIIVLNNGEVEAYDTPKNLLKISPTYQKMVSLQELEKEVEGGKTDGGR